MMTTCIGGPLHGQQVEHTSSVMHTNSAGEDSRIVAYHRREFWIHDECYHFYVFSETPYLVAQQHVLEHLFGTQPTVDKTT